MNAPEETDHKLKDLIAVQDMRIARMRSELAQPEPAGPLPVVGSGGVVGLLRDDLIAVMSHVHDESIKAEWARDEYSHNRQRTQAAEARGRQRALSEVYTKLVEILVAENVRQQQPNTELSNDRNGESL